MSLTVFDHPFVLLVKSIKMQLTSAKDSGRCLSAEEADKSLQKLLDYTKVFKDSIWPPMASATTDLVQQLYEYSLAMCELTQWIPEECDREYANGDPKLLNAVKSELLLLGLRLGPHIRSVAAYLQHKLGQ